jgi:3-phenylpropionate/trans-cinnamate dioxygenase alpha subunit
VAPSLALIRKEKAMELSNLVRLEEGVLSPMIFADPDIYADELQRIFTKSWLFLGHESQIPKAGDFFGSYMAEDPVFMVRQKDGGIAAFLNQCRHRGMRVCRAEAGNAKNFTCTYHGWSYDIAGALKALPHEEQYGEIDKQEWGLRRVPRVESYKGLVFGNWDTQAPTLHDYFGEARFYVDGLVDRNEGGTEAIGGVHKWVIGCNWKMPAEQFSSDMYHAAFSHISALEATMPDDYDPEKHSLGDRDGLQFWTEEGHGGGYFVHDRPTPPMWVDPLTKKFLEESFEESATRIGRLNATRVSGHHTIFPNFSWLNGTYTIRVWHPRGPDKIEVWAWVLVPAKASAEVKNAMRKTALRTFGPSGMLEQDDGENWSEVQKVLKGAAAREARLCYGMALNAPEIHVKDGPGTHHGPLFSDRAALNFYRRWMQLMGA